MLITFVKPKLKVMPTEVILSKSEGKKEVTLTKEELKKDNKKTDFISKDEVKHSEDMGFFSRIRL